MEGLVYLCIEWFCECRLNMKKNRCSLKDEDELYKDRLQKKEKFVKKMVVFTTRRITNSIWNITCICCFKHNNVLRVDSK